VLAGEMIADAEAFVSAPIHAPTSGVVADIKPMPHPLGRQVMSIIITPDGKDEWLPLEAAASAIDDIPVDEIIRRVRAAGLVGLGGAAFPTHVKLSPPPSAAIDLLLINAVECEPYLTADFRVMMEQSERVRQGILLLRRALKVTQAIVAIEDNKPRAIEQMKRACVGDAGIRVVSVKTKYPQGSEKQLIAAVVRRQVPSGKLPLDVGVVVQNVGTAAACADAVLSGRPLIERVVTVTGGNVKKSANLRVRLGTSFADCVAFCGGTIEQLSKVLMGGPMMGVAVASLDVPVIKGTSGILLLTRAEARFKEPGPCIRCGRCLEACPMGLAPGRFIESGETGDCAQALKDNITSCMECGACSYVCPARRPMVQWIRIAKSQLQKQAKKTL